MRLSSRAIFLMFCAIGASRHCSLTLFRPRIGHSDVHGVAWRRRSCVPRFPCAADKSSCPVALNDGSVHSAPRRLPHMPRHHFHHVLTARTLSPQRTFPADLRIGVVLPIALAVGGAILQQLLVGTDIHIAFRVIAKLVFAKQPFSSIRPPISCDSVNPALFQPLRQGCRRIARIQSNRLDLKPESLPVADPAASSRAPNRAPSPAWHGCR